MPLFNPNPDRWEAEKDSGIDLRELPNVEPVRPLLRFENVHEFSKRHGIGTRKEFILESSQHKEFNNMQIFYAWPILVLSDEKNSCDYLFLVQPGKNHSMLPKEGERCMMKLPKGDFTYPPTEGEPKQFSTGTDFVRAEAVRIGNPCSSWEIKDSSGYWEKTFAFEVNIVKSKPHPFKVIMDAEAVEEGFSEIPRPKDREVSVAFELRLSTSTRDAELGALDEFISTLNASTVGQSALQQRRREACEFLLAFNATSRSSFYETFPHVADPLIALQNVSPQLKAMFEDLNEQQVHAFKDLTKIHNNICLVAGGPGAGKTHWNLCLVAALQSKHEHLRPGEAEPCPSRNQVLYIVDINSSATDVANKLVRMYDTLKLNRNVIRFFTWNDNLIVTTAARLEAQRQEVRHRLARERNGQEEDLRSGPWAKYDAAADESRKVSFTHFVLRRSRPGLKWKRINHRHEADNRVAPTLEEAAFEYYTKHKDSKYKELRNLLATEYDDLGQLKDYLVNQVYMEFLQILDVIVTTPVTASKFARVIRKFDPKLLIFDEAPHARELSFLIPITLFNPRFWIFTGDHRQTKPYVGSHGTKYKINEFVLQLRTSTMERAAKNLPNMTSLLINHRARGGLHEPASTMFYGSKMIPAIKPGNPGAIPPSTEHLRQKYIMPMKGNKGKQVSRLVVVLENARFNREGSRVQGSLSNDVHREWVEGLVLKLVNDPLFLQTNGKDHGTILIMSPYKKAVNEYKGMVRDIRESRDGLNGCVVEARTVDTTQGHEADVCVLDLVSDRVTSHLDDPNRLCVALTRARQAEFILMNSSMVSTLRSSGRFSRGHLASMLKHCMDAEEFVRIG